MAIFYPNPKTSSEFESNVVVAKQSVARQLGLPLTDATASEIRELSPADQVRFVDALSVFIAERPAYFSEKTLAVARQRVSSPGFGQPLRDTSYSAALAEYGDEVLDRAADLATAFPRALFWLVALGVVAFVVVKFLPGSIAEAKGGTAAK